MADFNRESKTFSQALNFTRASQAHYWDANGGLQLAAVDAPRFDHDPVTGEAMGLQIEEARTNSLQYPRRFYGPTWNQSNVSASPVVVLGPDGDGAAYKLVADASANGGEIGKALTQSSGLGAGSTGQYRIIAKAAEYSFVTLSAYDRANVYYAVTVDLIDGTVTQTDTPNGGSAATVEVVALPNGWYDIKLSKLLDGAFDGSNFFLVGSPGTGAPGTYPNHQVVADGTSGIYLWHAQLEQGSFPTSLIPDATTLTSRASTATYLDSNGVLQTAAIDEARDNAYGYDENGVLRPIGLLLEPQRTNLWPWSDDVSKLNGFGTIRTVDSVIADTNNGDHHCYPYSPSTDGLDCTLSFRVKQLGTTVPNIYLSNLRGGLAVSIDLTTGAVSDVSFLVWSGSGGSILVDVQPETDGWLKVNAQVTMASSGPRIFLSNGSTYSFVGDGSSGINLKNYQVEEAPYASSYIPTAGAQVTRSADVSSSPQVTRAADDCSRTLGAEFNASEGTFYVEFDTTIRGKAGIFEAGDGTRVERFGAFFPSIGYVRAFLNTRGAIVVTEDLPIPNATELTGMRVAVSYDSAYLTLAVNGAGTATVNLAGATPLGIASLVLADFDPQNVNLPERAYYREALAFPRALTQTELEELTAP